VEIIASAFVAFLVGTWLVAGAVVTGQQPELCDLIGGTYEYTERGADVCPDGRWAELVGLGARVDPR